MPGVSLAVAAELPGPGIIALMGMGTVFLCLAIIYLIMSLMGRFMGPKDQAQAAAKPSFEATGEEAGDMGMPGAEEFKGLNGKTAPAQEVIAAISIALQKHRKAKVGIKLAPPAEGGLNPWKLSGRIRGRLR